MPKVHIEGLMSGALAPELSGQSYIRSSSGYTIKIEYQCKGWIGGRRNGFVASVYHDGREGEVLYTVEGVWSDSWVTREGKNGKIIEKFEIDAAERSPLQVRPVEEQHPLESRRAWRYVVDAIQRGDIFGVGHEKSKIENEQRELRKREKSEEKEWQRKYFSKAEEDKVAEKLAEGIKANTSMKGQMDGGHPLWMWDQEKYKNVQNNTRNGIKSPTRMRFDSGVGMVLTGMEGVSLNAQTDWIRHH
jgi:hypothetical protein